MSRARDHATVRARAKSDAEALATATGTLGVRVLELESRTAEAVYEIHLRAHQIQVALGIDEEQNVMARQLPIAFVGPLRELQEIGKT